jgi:hypothetical protein
MFQTFPDTTTFPPLAIEGGHEPGLPGSEVNGSFRDDLLINEAIVTIDTQTMADPPASPCEILRFPTPTGFKSVFGSFCYPTPLGRGFKMTLKVIQ